MKLIVGLGNPGREYESTRHNIGFMIVDKLAHELGGIDAPWKEDSARKAMVARVGDVILAKPLTFMNNSGLAVGALLRFYKLAPQDLWVLHDDIDLPLGKIRIRERGSAGGHHGIESIIAVVKSDAFVRFRMGIGRGKSIVDFVLSRFTQHEAGELKHLVKHGTEAVQTALLDGLDRAQNRFH
ncbi:MAG: aminoacyl-tRNA hydrolase [Patescibacteria group bacterium]